MTPSATPGSALGKQLLAEMEEISRTPFRVGFWGVNAYEQARAFEGEQQRVRVLTNYVVQLLDRIEKLESRVGSE